MENTESPRRGPANAEVSAASPSAAAYATGDAVAFATSPDLRQAAHEAAHVVQQRGGVRLDGGVGQGGDVYEQHAEAVAQLVVRGDSAQGLLDQHAPRGGGGGPAVQKLDSHEIIGDTMSATRGRGRGHGLDERSQRRVVERIAELEGRDPTIAGEEFAAMAPAARSTALREAVTRFQTRPDGHALIEEITGDNADALYGRRDDDARAEAFGRKRDGEPIVRATDRATYAEGEVAANDVTMQALANAWPQRMFGRLLSQEQAYHLLHQLVVSRGLPFDPEGVNVVGMRAFQGELHDNGEGEAPAAPAAEPEAAAEAEPPEAAAEASPHRRRRASRPRREDPSTRAHRRIFTRHNRYDDTLYTLSRRDGMHLGQTTRGTVDPGDGATSVVASRLQVASDQQWDYGGNPTARSTKYGRPMYGLPDRGDVRFGRSWDEEAERAPAAPHDGRGRVIHRPHGELELDVRAAGEARRVSALHSGSSGGATGEETSADSTGCTVVHGDWYAHFNEGLRRADEARRDAHAGEAGAQLTYSLIDPRDVPPEELEALLDQAAQEEEEGGRVAASSEAAG